MLVGVFVAVGVSVGVLVGTFVAVGVGVSVGVLVGTFVAVGVGVSVGVLVGTFVAVGVSVGVLTGVSVGVGVLIGVGVSEGQQPGASTWARDRLSMAAQARPGEPRPSAALAMRKPAAPRRARKPRSEMARFTLAPLLTPPHRLGRTLCGTTEPIGELHHPHNQKSRRLQRPTIGKKAAAEDSPRMLSSAARLS